MKYLNENRDRDVKTEFVRKNTKPNAFPICAPMASGSREILSGNPGHTNFRSYFP